VHTPLAGREDLVTNYHKRAERFDPAAPRFADEEQVWDRAEPRRVRVVQDHPVYAAMVEAVDEQLGRLLDALENMGLEENTVVFVVSDNGGLSTAEGSPTSNLPLRGGKGWLYEGGLRVPLLVRWPGVTEGGPESDTPVHTHDVFASVLDAAGLEAEGTSGVSLRLSMRDRRRDRELFFHYPHYSNQGGFPGGVLIDGDWKLVRRYEDGSLNLYNVRRDPGESTDLAATERRRAQRMARRLDRWLIETGAFPLSARPDGPAPWTPRSDP
ncbi:MAG: sulfatase-like hydrolase/transferase, partial [Planctomycetota bacterium]